MVEAEAMGGGRAAMVSVAKVEIVAAAAALLSERLGSGAVIKMKYNNLFVFNCIQEKCKTY